jgi:hypothetical protein
LQIISALHVCENQVLIFSIHVSCCISVF